MGLGAASVAAQYVVTDPQPSHNPINLDFLLDPLSKSEFLSFFISPIDFLPEALLGPLGYLDDLALTCYVLRLSRYCGPATKMY